MSKLIDPHLLFNNLRNVNVEDLYIYADLHVTRRDRTINGISNEKISISFMGYSDGKTFTTDWTENKENFGIRSINIETNASYVPKVNIEFIDIRGQALFNDTNNSKYKCLFELPPPIFELEVKGFYGKSCAYRLHMVKQNTRWENGSYIIKAEFIGLTFAPLSDMLVDFINVAPYLNNNSNLPTDRYYLNYLKNTKKTINKIEKEIEVYASDINNNKEKIDELEELKKINSITDKIKSDLLSVIEDKSLNDFYEIKVDNRDKKNNTLQILVRYYETKDSIDRYDTFIESYDEIRELFALKVDSFVKYKILSSNSKYSISEYLSYNKIDDNLTSYFNEPLLSLEPKLICTLKIDNSESLDIKINKLIDEEREKIKKSKSDLDESKKFIISNNVDISLKNVLSVILENAKLFYDEMKTLVNTIESKNRSGKAGKSNDLAKYAFPEFWGDKDENGITKTIKMHPNGGEYDSWDEIDFIKRYIDAKKEVQNVISDINELRNTNDDLDYNLVKIKGDDDEINYWYNDKNDYNKILRNIEDRIISMEFFYDDILKEEAYDNEVKYITDFISKNTLLSNRFINESYVSDVSGYNKTEKLDNARVSIYKGDYDSNDVIFDSSIFNNIQTLNKIPFYDTYNCYSVNNVYTGRFNNLNVQDTQFSNFIESLKESNKNNYSLDEILFKYNDNIYTELRELLTNDDMDWISLGIVKAYEMLSSDIVKKRRGYYVLPKIILAIIYYKLKEKNLYNNKSDITFFKICKEVYDNMNKEIIISNGLKNIKTISEFGNHSDVEDLFKPITLFVYKDSVYTKENTFHGIESVSFKNNKTINNRIDKVIGKIRNELKNTLNNKNEVAKNVRNLSIEHSELTTELYYTFKSFVDKWIYSTPTDIENVFSLENFITVDRGYNDIGNDLIMDLAPLYNIEYSVDTSLYTLLLNLLGRNNLNFFALPSFIDYNNNQGWSDASSYEIFGTQEYTKVKASPKFICMYIGGFSSSLDINNSDFINDSDLYENIVGIDNTQCFKVDIGAGNQSYFLNVELDQQEYKETNESIILLDEITNTNGNQNKIATNSLMNIYEQRSYSCTVKMLGCVMIQPTMYFQLNVPMFKGTYLIIEVSHSIENNNTFYTTFKGVRVPKVSKPYVNTMEIESSFRNAYSASTSEGIISNVPLYIKDSNLKSNAKLSNKEKAFLDMISWAEGMHNYKSSYLGYDVMFNGKTISNWTPQTPQQHPNNSNGGSSASGRYQILYNSWLEYWGTNKQFGITEQDEFAINTIRKEFAKDNINLENATKDNFIYYIDAVANIWASLPFFNKNNTWSKSKISNKNWSSGDSMYEFKGKSQLQSKNTINALWTVYNEGVLLYDNKINSLKDLNDNQKKFINQLHPYAKRVFTKFITRVKEETNYDIFIVHGFRKDGDVINGKVVEPSENSLHKVGLALDINIMNKNGNIVIRNENSELEWRKTGIINIANEIGLHWGYTYNDRVHFEIQDKNNTKFGESLNLYRLKNNLTNLNNLTFNDLNKIKIDS